MITVYKLPAGITATELRAAIQVPGGSVNPVQDANGNWIITEQEWNCPDFQQFKTQYAEIAAQFTAIPWQAPNPEII